MLKSLVSLYVSDCSNLESLPEDIGDLENLEILDASFTLISRPPSSTFRLNKLKFLSFEKQKLEVGLDDVVYFVFPQVNEGLRSLEILNLSYCNLIDGGLPEDIGSLFSLKELYLDGNHFEHLPRSIAQLGALRSLHLKECKRLKELSGFMGMPNLETLNLSNCMNLEESPDFTGMPNLVTLELSNCINLEEVHHSLGFLQKLCTLKLTNCKWLKRFPALCINSLEDLDLEGCSSLENFPEILGSMKVELKSGIRYLDLRGLENLVTLPSSICKLKSLVSLNVSDCSSLESFPEAIGDLENLERLDATYTLISQPPPSIVRLNKLKFLTFAKRFSVGFEDGVYFVFPQVDEGLHSLEHLDLSYCNLIDGGLPEDIGCLYSLERLYLDGNNFEHLPRSIVQLAALRFLYLSNCNVKEFPQVNEGVRLLELLDLSYCNLIDGGLPEDFGCLYSLKKMYLSGNNFEHLPQSIAQLGALRSLDLSNCKRLKELPGFMGMQNLEILNLSNCINLEEVHHSLEFFEKLSELWLIDCRRLKRFPGLCINFLKYMGTWGCSSLESYPKLIGSMEVESEIHMLDCVMRDLNSMYISFPRSLSQDIVSLKHGISASASLSQRVFTIVHDGNKIPSWFQYQGMNKSVSVNLPEKWYVSDNFLGFAVCFSGSFIYKTTITLIPLCDDGMSWMTWKLILSYHSTCDPKSTIQFFLVPLAGLWDASKANGKTPNDYGLIRLSFSKKIKYGFRLLYKDEPELEALLKIRENTDEPTEHRIITSIRYDNSEHHDSVTNEASCSSSMKQKSHSNIRGRVASLFRNCTALSCKPRNSA